MTTYNKIIKSLEKEFPGKKVILNSTSIPTEIICEVEPSGDHPNYSIAIVYIRKTDTHKHIKTTETYKVETGKLILYLGDAKQILLKDQSYIINPGIIHRAEGNWARVKVTSNPGWTISDHLIQ